MNKLQVIPITPEFRERLAQIRRERYEQDAAAGPASSTMAVVAIAALIYLAGILAAYVTGLGEILLNTLPAIVRPVALLLVGTSAGAAVLALIYAYAHSHEDAEEYREHRV